MQRFNLAAVIVLSLIAVPALAFNVGTFSVLGCTFNGNVGAFTTCISNSANNKASAAAAAADKAARDALQPTIDELQNSPFLAQIDAEKQLLLAARNGGIAELASCLQQAGVNLGSAISSIANDPTGVSGARLVALTEAHLAQLTPQLGTLLQRSRSFDPRNPPSPNELADRAFDALVALADHDPIAKCGKSLLLAQETALKQSAVQLYGTLEARMNQFVATALEPAVRSAALEILEQQFAPLQAKASGPRRTQRPPAKGRQLQRPNMKNGPAANMQRQAPAQRANAPRTRSAGSFINQQQQQITALTGALVEQAQPLVASMLPDDIERIAHAELAGHLYRGSQFRSAGVALQAIASGDRSSNNLNTVRAFQLRLAERDPEMYTRIALTTINLYGLKTIDTVISPIVGWTLDGVAGAIGLVDGVTGVVCSTAGAVSALKCFGVKDLPKLMINVALIPIIDYLLVTAIEESWNNACDCMAVAVGLADSADSQTCAKLQPLLRHLPATTAEAMAWIMPHIDESQRNLVTYHGAVVALTNGPAVGSRR